MKGQILNVSTLDPWEHKEHGTFYPHWIKLVDGKTIRLNKKEPDAFNPGDELWYEIKEEKRTKNDALYYDVKQIKPPEGEYPQKSHDSGAQKATRQRFGGGQGSNASFALSYAKDLAVAMIGAAGKPFPMEAVGGKVIELAEEFQAWLDKQHASERDKAVTELAQKALQFGQDDDRSKDEKAHDERSSPETAAKAKVARNMPETISAEELRNAPHHVLPDLEEIPFALLFAFIGLAFIASMFAQGVV